MDILFDLFFPKKCVVCDEVGVMLCDDCLGKLNKTVQKCPSCCQQSLGGKTHFRCFKPRGMDGLVSLWSYRQREVQKIVKAIKYRFNQELVNEIFEKIKLDQIKVDLIVPLPLHLKRQNQRGFNQAELIANNIAKLWGNEVVNLLIRKKSTKPLAEMKSREERKREIRGVFSLNKENRNVLRGKRVLLVDDVFTSGATMREAAKVLKQAGVGEVIGWTLAN